MRTIEQTEVKREASEAKSGRQAWNEDRIFWCNNFMHVVLDLARAFLLLFRFEKSANENVNNNNNTRNIVELWSSSSSSLSSTSSSFVWPKETHKPKDEWEESEKKELWMVAKALNGRKGSCRRKWAEKKRRRRKTECLKCNAMVFNWAVCVPLELLPSPRQQPDIES